MQILRMFHNCFQALSHFFFFIAFVLIKFEIRFLEFATGELRQFHKYKSVGTLKTLISKPTIWHCPLKILCYLPYILEIQNVIVTKIVCRKQKFLRFAECVGQRGSRTGGNSQIIIMGFQDETPLPSRQRVLFWRAPVNNDKKLSFPFKVLFLI